MDCLANTCFLLAVRRVLLYYINNTRAAPLVRKFNVHHGRVFYLLSLFKVKRSLSCNIPITTGSAGIALLPGILRSQADHPAWS